MRDKEYRIVKKTRITSHNKYSLVYTTLINLQQFSMAMYLATICSFHLTVKVNMWRVDNIKEIPVDIS